MRELKSKGCVTVRYTENRLSCMTTSRRQIYYFTRGKWQPNNFTYSTRNKNFLIPAYTLHMMEVLRFAVKQLLYRLCDLSLCV